MTPEEQAEYRRLGAEIAETTSYMAAGFEALNEQLKTLGVEGEMLWEKLKPIEPEPLWRRAARWLRRHVPRN